MMRARRSLHWVSVLLPLCGYLTFIAHAEAERLGAPAIVLPIEGYDPRDPLRGHYLRYRFAFDGARPRPAGQLVPRPIRPPQQSGTPSERSAEQPPEPVAPRPTVAADANVCVVDHEQGSMLRADQQKTPSGCRHPFPTDFARRSHRFYVQQDRARELERAVREGRAAVRVLLLSEDRVVVDELLIDGKVWRRARPQAP